MLEPEAGSSGQGALEEARCFAVLLSVERWRVDVTLAQVDVISSTRAHIAEQISRLGSSGGQRGLGGPALAALVASVAPSRIVGASEADRPTRMGHRSAGFSVVEVIVALAVLSATIGVLLNMIGNGLHHGRHAERAAEAAALAQSLLAEVGTQRPIKPGESDGEFARGYRWRLQVKAFGDAIERRHWPVGAYTVIAEVSWTDGERDQSFALTTLRLGLQESGN